MAEEVSTKSAQMFFFYIGNVGSISTNSRMLNRNIDVPKYSEPSKISLGYPNYPKMADEVGTKLTKMFSWISLLNPTLVIPMESQLQAQRVGRLCSFGEPDPILQVRCT